jgi:hypothetical protein
MIKYSSKVFNKEKKQDNAAWHNGIFVIWNINW